MPLKKSNKKPLGLTAERAEVRRIADLLRKLPLTLRSYHAIGEQMRRLADDPAVAYHGSGWREALAGLVDSSPSKLSKALQFRLAYEEEDLPALEELDVGWTLLTIALGVEDKRERHRLVRQAKKEKWTEPELQRVIQGRLGKRRGGGRPRRELRSRGVLADLGELNRLTSLWLEFNREVWSKGLESYPEEAAGLDGPARQTLDAQLEEARNLLQGLRKGVEGARAVAKTLHDHVSEEVNVGKGGICPSCQTRIPALPGICPGCGMLVAGPASRR